MGNEKRDFDKEAAAWDEKPHRITLAKDVAQAISQQIVLTSETKVLDFGCGTGLLSLHLQPLVRSITGVDSSPGMIEILKTKITGLGLKNIEPKLIDLDKGEPLTGQYDLVISNMTLHHIKTIEPLFTLFHKILVPGGYLGLSDLDLENGRFHDDNTGVFHFGFDRSILRTLLTAAGFDDVRDSTASEIVRPTDSGEVKRFTVFLITGRKVN